VQVLSLSVPSLEFACFLALWAAQLGVVMRDMVGINKLEKFAAPPVLFMLTSALLEWAYASADGFKTILSQPPIEFWKVFFPSLAL
jgi:nucleobase:cation symporter-1, NCS1 family